MQTCIICHFPTTTLKSINGVSLLYCSKCTVHVLRHIPNQESLDAYYSSSYNMSADEILASEHRRIFRLPEMYWLISQLEKYEVHSGSTILDIGCDKGYFLDQCRRFGYKVQGVEPSSSARVYCDQVGLNVMSHLDQVQSEFDAITLWHVLEHFTNPHQLMKDCNSKLKQGGRIFIRVPDFTSFWSRILGSYWIWFQPNNHYVHYSRKSIISLLEQHGFEIIQCQSRKPNDKATWKAGFLADTILFRSFGYKQSLKKILGRIYEHFTGVELYLIATKK